MPTWLERLRNWRMKMPLVLLAAGLAATGWWWRGEPVRIVMPQRGNAAEVVYATGVVEPLNWAKVSALQRKRIVEMCRCEGKQVKAGDVLGRLDDIEERAALTELQARRDRLKEDSDRIRGLVDRNVSSRVTLDEKLTQLREYDARILAQRDRLSDLELRAPMDGVVLRRDGEVGEIAGIGVSDVLFWIGEPKPLRITAEVNEDDIAKVSRGQTVLLRHEGFASNTLRATIDGITPKGDPASKTFRVYFALPDDTPMKIGMSVEANIVTREVKSALLIPADSVRDGAVWTIEGGRLRRVAVQTGVRGTGMIEILSGIAEGQPVVTPARSDFKTGFRVSATLERAR